MMPTATTTAAIMTDTSSAMPSAVMTESRETMMSSSMIWTMTVVLVRYSILDDDFRGPIALLVEPSDRLESYRRAAGRGSTSSGRDSGALSVAAGYHFPVWT